MDMFFSEFELILISYAKRKKIFVKVGINLG